MTDYSQLGWAVIASTVTLREALRMFKVECIVVCTMACIDTAIYIWAVIVRVGFLFTWLLWYR